LQKNTQRFGDLNSCYTSIIDKVLSPTSDGGTIDRYTIYESYKGPGYIQTISREQGMERIDYNYYNIFHSDSKQETLLTRTFHKSVKVYYSDQNFAIAYQITAYIDRLLIGWFLLNWKKYIDCEIYLTVDITDKIIINFYKKQNRSMKITGNSIVITLPNIQHIKVNGVQYYI
jgi:hypothetical protein